jgi:uncharacterized protein YjbI with pentapeptide repeats
MSKDTKACKICGEEIKSTAVKCIHCGQLIEFPAGWSDWWKASMTEIKRDKTLWDIVSLLFMPVVLAGLAFTLSSLETRRQDAIADRRATAEAKVEGERAKDAVLQTYLDRMSELLLKKDLRVSVEGDEARVIARARTLTVLYQLDEVRKGLLLRFLYESELITGGEQTAAVVDLVGANLREIDLRGASLREAYLRAACLPEAKLPDADLRDAYLHRANLNKADLSNAYLSEADLRNADLRYADLRWADLNGADLREAYLREADLREADLNRADLREAYLYGAKLLWANLSGADLSGANLSEANLSGAEYSDDTIWPDGFNPEEAGAMLVSEE